MYLGRRIHSTKGVVREKPSQSKVPSPHASPQRDRNGDLALCKWLSWEVTSSFRATQRIQRSCEEHIHETAH